ncbi:hypothetical protein Misp01_46080 [Microtetraspora sp. NBRC 13810]|uniref:MBL fold metallo-hydrolase n=1 Tax=Microtetraspora sp. NBRC 13810 TaxID=3030990 RepID=UPI0024A597D6|nr:MBL fold metallo-hydrolase [Microtetraspora sp. NBRC 13810]GLW09479.1 hypothetical protein Misp01_46080 [Microtetraspora sp. NBRC 13810]
MEVTDTHLRPRMVAGIEVIPLCDAIGPMGGALAGPLSDVFLGVRPGDLPDGWILHFHCFLLRDPAGTTVLVDTGIGGADSTASTWAPVPGVLGSELARVGVAPADVDVVVLTHLHSDHASGAVHAGVPVFPNARHVVQQAELDWINGIPSHPISEAVLRPLDGALLTVSGAAEVTPGVTVVPAPGHTPGHQVVEVGDVVITGDVILHPIQLADPAIVYAHDEDSREAAATRADLIHRVRAAGGTLAPAHFPEPFVTP